MPIVFLGLGSNLGNRAENIQKAQDFLNGDHIQILQVSSTIETLPVGGIPQGKFLNCVLKVKTNLAPQELLQVCQIIEKKLGRIPTVRNGPRIIDLDILLYDQTKINSPDLTIPHPRMNERDFVLVPLKEIYPEYEVPSES